MSPLLQEVGTLDLGTLDRARVTWVEETAFTRPLDAARFASLIAAAEQAGAAGDHDLHVDLLWLVASRAWWVDPGPEVRRALIDAARRLGDADAEDPRVFAVHAYADPLGHAAGVLARLDAGGGRRCDSTPMPPASSGRPRSSSARSTSATISSRRPSTVCGPRAGSGICRGC